MLNAKILLDQSHVPATLWVFPLSALVPVWIFQAIDYAACHTDHAAIME
jgi:hypothetical protein